MGKRTGDPRGRPLGSKNLATVERELRAADGIKAAMQDGELPLDVMLKVMRGDKTITERQYVAARDAAPYIHPKLAAVELEQTGEVAHHVVMEEPMSEEEWLKEFGRKAPVAPDPDGQAIAGHGGRAAEAGLLPQNGQGPSG